MRPGLAEFVKRDPWIVAIAGWATLYALVTLGLSREAAILAPDSTDYAEAARSLVRGQGDTIDRVMFHTGLFAKIRHPLEVHGLLQPILIAPLFALFGAHGALVRVPSVLFAGALGVLVFWAGRRLFGLVGGLLATCLVLTRADMVFAALLGADDIGLAFFACAAIACFAVGVSSRERGWFVACGLATAFAALEKFSGMVLPGALGAALILNGSARRAVGFKNWLWTVLPLVPVAGLYALRNYRVYGTLGSPYGAIEWYGKAHFPAYFALYEKLPPVPKVLAELGTARVLGLISGELAEVANAVRGDALLLLGTICTLALLRRQTVFAVSVLFYTLGLLFVVCVLHHVEVRYLSGLIPLNALSVAGVGSILFSWLEQRVAVGRAAAMRSAVLGLLVVGSLTLATPRQVAVALAVNESMKEPGPCADALHYLRTDVAPDAAVLTSNPWLVSWGAERPAVNAPTNGTEALLKVVEHYRIRWALSGRAVLGALPLEEALRSPELSAKLHPELVFDGAPCDVYRLHP